MHTQPFRDPDGPLCDPFGDAFGAAPRHAGRAHESGRDWWAPPTKLGVPKIFDLVNDPKEEYPATLTPNGWVAVPMMKIVTEFENSLKKDAPIAPGTPDPYKPKRK